METKYKIADIEYSKKDGNYFANPRYVSENLFFTKLYEKLCLVTESPEQRANIKKEFLEKAKSGHMLLVSNMKFTIETI